MMTSLAIYPQLLRHPYHQSNYSQVEVPYHTITCNVVFSFSASMIEVTSVITFISKQSVSTVLLFPSALAIDLVLSSLI